MEKEEAKPAAREPGTGPPTHVFTTSLPKPISVGSNFKYMHLVTGGIAGAVSRTLTAPIDRVKIIRQCGSKEYAKVSMKDIFPLILRKEGIAGFFKGNGTNVVRVVPFSAIEFATFDQVKVYYFEEGQKRDKKSLLICGGISGVVASTFTYPLDMIRARLTLNMGMNQSIISTMITVARNEGPFALYKGWVMTLIGIAPYIGLKMAFFDSFKPILIPPPDDPWFTIKNMSLGATAGTFAATMTYPTDLLRRMMQMKTKESPYKNVIGAAMHIMRTDGLRGFYRGLIPCYLKVVPSVGIAFGVNEKLKVLFGVPPKKT